MPKLLKQTSGYLSQIIRGTGIKYKIGENSNFVNNKCEIDKLDQRIKALEMSETIKEPDIENVLPKMNLDFF